MFKTNETSLALPLLKPHPFHLLGYTHYNFYLLFNFSLTNDRENYLKLYKENHCRWNCNDAIYWEINYRIKTCETKMWKDQGEITTPSDPQGMREWRRQCSWKQFRLQIYRRVGQSVLSPQAKDDLERRNASLVKSAFKPSMFNY